jgi:nucleoid-associated protein YgaU
VAASAVAIAGMSIAGGLVSATSAGAAPSPSAWAALRNCESSGNYAADTGNGYYGAYQFDLSTWASLGYSGLPSSASPATQDAAAQTLYAQRGSEPWPVCGAYLSSGSSVAAPAPAPVVSTSAPVSTAASSQETEPDGDSDDAPAAAAPWTGTFYTVQPGDTLWQLAINYGVTVDGIATMNSIPNPNLIYVGQVIVV